MAESFTIPGTGLSRFLGPGETPEQALARLLSTRTPIVERTRQALEQFQSQQRPGGLAGAAFVFQQPVASLREDPLLGGLRYIQKVAPSAFPSIQSKLASGAPIQSFTPQERQLLIQGMDWAGRELDRQFVRSKQRSALSGVSGKAALLAAGGLLSATGAFSNIIGGITGKLPGGLGNAVKGLFGGQSSIPSPGSLFQSITGGGGGFTASSPFGQSFAGAFNESLSGIGPNTAAALGSTNIVSGILPVATKSIGTVTGALSPAVGGGKVSFLSDLFGGVAKDLISTGVKSLVQGFGVKQSLNDLSKLQTQITQGAQFSPFNIRTPVGQATFVGKTGTAGLEPGLAALSAGLLAQAGPAISAGVSPEASLGFLSKVAGPLFEQKRLSLESRLFNQGILGSTAGAEQLRALERAQNEALLSNAIQAQGQQFNVGQGLLEGSIKLRQLPLGLLQTGGTFGLSSAQAFPRQELFQIGNLAATTRGSFFSSLGEGLGDTLKRLLG